MNSYITVLKNYAVFEGRSRRSEYWYFTLITTIISILIGYFDDLLPHPGESSAPFSAIYYLATLVPSLAVSARRLHDIGKTGWWNLLLLLPFLGWLILVVWACQDSDHGDNQYGPNPKQQAAAIRASDFRD